MPRRQMTWGKIASWGWLAFLLLVLGCQAEPFLEAEPTITYIADSQVQSLLDQDMAPRQDGIYQRPKFIGLKVPEAFLPFEPFVLGLATASPVPTILFLDAPWVQRYASAGWLYELERPGVFEASRLVPAVAAAFSSRPPGRSGRQALELMAVPSAIKGNILFYRRDLLARYRQEPPRTWEELKAICRLILPREKSLRYGVIFHSANFVNDFYPIFWSFGGQIFDDDGNLALMLPEMQAKAVAALEEVISWQGKIAPGPQELAKFAPPLSLRRSFLRGEALFMINWNTRLQDLKEMLAQDPPGPQGLSSLEQIGVAPIPGMHPGARYSNIGSFGWGINRFAVTNYPVMVRAKEFLNLVVSDRVQLQLAERYGQVPSLLSALQQVQNPEVKHLYQGVFAAPGVILKARPHSRQINNILEKHLLLALRGQISAAASIQAAVQEIQALNGKD